MVHRSKIARELVGKLLADMANMREESLMTANTWEEGGWPCLELVKT